MVLLLIKLHVENFNEVGDLLKVTKVKFSLT